jgi:hypothetical protein
MRMMRRIRPRMLLLLILLIRRDGRHQLQDEEEAHSRR